jgi:hypothetical protein
MNTSEQKARGRKSQWLRGQDLNLRPSGYEPNKIDCFPLYIQGGGQMVDSEKWFKNRTFYPNWRTNVGL